MPSWEEYRKLTSKCETCGQEMKSHRQCTSCKILIGVRHLEDYSNSNGECDWCVLHPRFKKAEKSSRKSGRTSQ